MPRVPRGPRRPSRLAWHRLARASLAGPAAASLPAIMAAPALAMGAAGEAPGSSFDALSAKMNVLVHVPLISSPDSRVYYRLSCANEKISGFELGRRGPFQIC